MPACFQGGFGEDLNHRVNPWIDPLNLFQVRLDESLRGYFAACDQPGLRCAGKSPNFVHYCLTVRRWLAFTPLII
jgi:hypothetical protein